MYNSDKNKIFHTFFLSHSKYLGQYLGFEVINLMWIHSYTKIVRNGLDFCME